MKSKLNLKLILISILLVLLSIALVACGTKPGGGGEEGGGGGGDKPVATTFTVTFNSNGSSMVYDNQQVVYGGKITNPNKGDTANDPFKTGYTFKWWSEEGNTDVAWDFDTNTITSATTLIAVYDANRYIHTLDLNSTNPEAYCDQTTFTSTYNQSSTMPIPKCMDDHGTASDQFLYWYYLDADNKEVRFSYWISYTMQTSASGYSSSTDYYTRSGSIYSIPDEQPTSSADFDDDTKPKYFVRNSLSESSVFTLDKVLTLKAKWYSQLPTTEDEDNPIAANKVVFLPDNGSAESSVIVKYNDTVAAPVEPTKTNYQFDGWYIAVENENGTIEYDGKKYSLTSTEFHFDTGEKCGEFDKVTDKTILAAKWTRYFEIASAADWETLAGMINIDETTATDEQKKDAQELLAGKIVLTGDISLDDSYTMILGSFSGEFDGQYDDAGVLKSHSISITLTSAYRPTNPITALFEKVTGTVKHIDITLSYELHKLDEDPSIFTEEYNKTFYIAGLAGVLDNATIQNVNVNANISIPGDYATSYEDYSFTIGGLAAYMTNSEVTGSWTAKGSISASATMNAVRVGILAGKADYSVISQGSSDSVSIDINNRGPVTAGGLIGETLSSEITGVSFTSDTNAPAYVNVVTLKETYVGGIVGKLVYSSISKCYIQGTKDYISRVFGWSTGNQAAVGGLVGLNQGFINNSYVQYAKVETRANTYGYAGGIAGKCFNDSQSYAFGKIEYCYVASIMTDDNDSALQDAINVVSLNEDTTVFAGGIAGDSAGCSIARCFAYTGVTVDLHNGNKAYSFGYISGHRNTSSSVDNSYSDIDSKVTLTSYPMVPMKVTATTGTTYTYNFDDEFAFNIELNGVTKTIGTQSFQSGQFMYTAAGWSNTIWNLFNGDPIVYVDTLPTLRA